MPDNAAIRIDGVDYDLPQLATLDLDELVILYNYSGLTIDQAEEAAQHFHPGMVKALLILAVHRAKPEVKLSEVADRVGKLNLPELADAFASPAEGDADPPPAETSTSGDGSAPDTGPGLSVVSESSPEDATPPDTGRPPSATGSPSTHKTLAV